MLLLFLAACRIELGPPAAIVETDTPKGEVWVYTSMYPEVINDLDSWLREVEPDVRVQWFPSGSEKIAQRTEAEIESGGTKACLLMTSDPFWYEDLKERGELQQHFSPNILHYPRVSMDPDGTWATARVSLMVLASKDKAPVNLAEAGPGFTTGDPLSSGTMFTAWATMTRERGWEWAEQLQAGGLVAAGGNGAVLTRLETGEAPYGMILLENLLKASTRGSPVKPTYPLDGAIPIPGPIALTSDCPNPTAARAVYDRIMSVPGQEQMTAGYMYSALPSVAPPPGAQPLQDLNLRPMGPEQIHDIAAERSAWKARWTDVRSQ